MKFAIIAAGEGSRLATEGVTQPKPLIPLCGVPMIERLIRIFHRCGAEEIIIAVNNARPETHQHLLQMIADNPTLPLRIVVADTPSSMHTFAALAPYLQKAPFCLTTVDTIFQEEAFRNYLQAATQHLQQGYDGCMAVTDFVDDESPLYIATTNQSEITAFLDEMPNHTENESNSSCQLGQDLFISGGYLHPFSKGTHHPLALYGRRSASFAQFSARSSRRWSATKSSSLRQNPRHRPRQ